MRNGITLCRPAVLFAAIAAVAGWADVRDAAATGPAPFVWPASLAPFGDGYPAAGDVCRQLGESPSTSDYLDHTATLVGCPGARDSRSAQAIVRGRHARVVGEVDGVTLISVPNEGSGADSRCTERRR